MSQTNKTTAPPVIHHHPRQQGLDGEEQAHQALQLAHNRLRTEVQSEIRERAPGVLGGCYQGDNQLEAYV